MRVLDAFKHLIETRCTDCPECRFISSVYRVKQVPDTSAMQRRNEMNTREHHKYEATPYRLFDPVARIFIHAIPFVKRDDQCATSFENITEQMQVLFDDTLMRIQHEYYYMSVLNGLQGFDDGKLFNGFSGLAALAD